MFPDTVRILGAILFLFLFFYHRCYKEELDDYEDTEWAFLSFISF